MTDPAAPVLLVLRALGLGDLCTGVPALRALRRAHPEHRMVLAAPAWQWPIVDAMGVDELVDTSGLASPPWRLGAVDIAVNLHGRGPTSTERLLERSPRRLLAFEHRSVSATAGGPAWCHDEHERERWCRLLIESGIPADPLDLLLPVPARPPLVEPGTVVVHPGAASPSRRWPTERFATVVAHLMETGYDVALTGSDREAGRCADVARAAAAIVGRSPADLSGRTDLDALASTVAVAAAVVCGDTGVAHLATALRTPSVVLFGPTSPDVWGPPPHRRHRVLWRGRTGDPHGDTLDPGLAAITVDEVISAWESLVTDPALDDPRSTADRPTLLDRSATAS